MLNILQLLCRGLGSIYLIMAIVSYYRQNNLDTTYYMGLAIVCFVVAGYQ